MPRKNSVKIYYKNGFYHVYNRGVEKRNIFLEPADYAFFLHLIKGALLPPELKREPEENAKRPRRENFYGKIDLLCYCLIANHFHFSIRQNDVSSITDFMRSICTSYSMHFNKKYHRVGSLFQGIFKAVDINDENYFLWLSRYIHRNPENFKDYPYSSYEDYLLKRNTPWLNKSIILDYFGNQKINQDKNYKSFVESEKENTIDLSGLTLEEEFEDD